MVVPALYKLYIAPSLQTESKAPSKSAMIAIPYFLDMSLLHSYFLVVVKLPGKCFYPFGMHTGFYILKNWSAILH